MRDSFVLIMTGFIRAHAHYEGILFFMMMIIMMMIMDLVYLLGDPP